VLLGEGRRVDIARSLTLTPRAASPPAHPAGTHVPASPPAPQAVTSTHPHAATPGHVEPLDDVIRRHIEHALVVCKGRIDGPFGAAHKLAINPHTLRARMRKLGVDWRRHRPL
jgi:DNA-binding NtrC family response regulator